MDFFLGTDVDNVFYAYMQQPNHTFLFTTIPAPPSGGHEFWLTGACIRYPNGDNRIFASSYGSGMPRSYFIVAGNGTQLASAQSFGGSRSARTGFVRRHFSLQFLNRNCFLFFSLVTCKTGLE